MIATEETWLNLGKTYEFMNEVVKANDCFAKAQDFTEKNNSSPAEIGCTRFETAGMSTLVGFIINYNAIKSTEVRLQFQTADAFFNQVFPQNEDLQGLASSIFSQYGNGMELLYHDYIGADIIEILQRTYGLNLKDLAYTIKNEIPKELTNLLYGSHISHTGWVKIIRKFIDPDKIKEEFGIYLECFQKYPRKELQILIRAIEYIGNWRNPSDHGKIINFKTVRHNRCQVIFLINQVLEIFSRIDSIV